MKLLYPRNGILTQGFLGNANTFYRDNGLSGHTGIDVFVGYGTTVNAIAGGEYVYKVFKNGNPTSDGAYAIFTLHNDPALGWVEFCYFHLSEVWVAEGDTLFFGQAIGKEGNTGTVYENGIRVTCQSYGCKKGSHRHYQGRNVMRTQSPKENVQYLSYKNDAYCDRNGFYYEITNYNNGANGCFDIYPHFYVPSFIEEYIILARALLYTYNQKPS